MFDIRLDERWRKFAREVGSIVLGVLIALGIGEVADDLRWRVRAADSTREMEKELARAAGVFEERAVVQPCLDRRLEQLEALVRTARRTGILPDIAGIGRPPQRPLPSAAWDDAVASGTLLHLDADQRAMLSLNYPLIKAFPQNTAQEIGHWANLSILEGVPGPASDTVLVEAAGILARLRWGSMINGVTAHQIRRDLAARGIGTSYFMILDREGTRAEAIDSIPGRPVCQPLSVSPGAVSGGAAATR